jgi:uncharacterized membrane protein YphA (DoxX/SURF4 family)
MRETINKVSRFMYRQSIALALIRIVAGLIFFVHGVQKFETLSSTEHFMVTLGLFAWVGVFIATIEVVGGLMLGLGILTRVAGLVLGVEMIVAIFLTGVGRGFAAHEFELLLAAVALAVAFAGSGRYSIWKMECNACGAMLCKGEPGACPGRLHNN